VPSEKTVAVVQSNYLPWKGYFDLIRRVDEFVLLDTVQYTRRDWRNRNRFKSPDGVRWLTVPVRVKGRYTQRIDETLVSDPAWPARHFSALRSWYSRAPFFSYYRPMLERRLVSIREPRLAVINRRLIETVCELIDVATPLTSASDYEATGRSTDLLISICRSAGATRYLSGPAACAYLDESAFADAGIAVEWMSYDGYPEYPQLHPPFDHHVSILDLLFSVGSRALDYMLPL
jgi:hypothetical protein